MRGPLRSAVVFLALLCEAAAEPVTLSHGDTALSTGCTRHQAVQDRLDILEETVEKTVEQLETEVKDLLSLLEGLTWTLPVALDPAPDLLGSSERYRSFLSAGGEEGPGSGE